MIVRQVHRPVVWVLSPDSTGAFDSTFSRAGYDADLVPAYAKGLIISIDIYEDGSRIINKMLRFTDHTGLENEWFDGTSASILDSVIQGFVNTYSTSLLFSDSTNPALPTPYQRSQLISKSYTQTLS